MLRLRTLGCLDLGEVEDEAALREALQPKRLALLTYLALDSHGGFHRRDSLVALLWPELDQAHARAALRKALHHLRALAPDLIVARGDDEVRVDPAALWCDASEVIHRAADSPEVALALYQGELLPGFHVPDAPEFERWLDQMRERLRAVATACALQLVAQSRTYNQSADAIRWAGRAVDLAPLEEHANHTLIEVLEAAGDRPGALSAYERYARRLADELDTVPGQAIQRRVAQLRATPGSAPEPEQADPPSVTDDRQVRLPKPSVSRPRRSWSRRLALALPVPLTPSGGMTPTATRPFTAVQVPRRRAVIAIAGLVGVALLVGIFWVGRATERGARNRPVTEREQLTASGNVLDPRLSPDGTRLAYVTYACTSGACLNSLVIRDLESGDTLTLVDKGQNIGSPSWTPDSRFLAFNGVLPKFGRGVFLVSTLGGVPRYYGCCDGTLTPDGDTLVIRGTSSAPAPEWLRYVGLRDGATHDSIPLLRPGTLGGPVTGRSRLVVLGASPSRGGVLRILDRRGQVTDSIPLQQRGSIFGALTPAERGILLSFPRGLSGDYDIVRYDLGSDGRLTGRIDTVGRQLPLRGAYFRIGQDNSLIFVQAVNEYDVTKLELVGSTWRYSSNASLKTTGFPSAALSPDGSKMAYVRVAPRGGVSREEVVVQPLDSVAIVGRRLFERVSGLDWTPNGERLLVAEQLPAERTKFALIEPATGSVRDLGTVPDLAPLFEATGDGGVIWTDGNSHLSILDATGGIRRIADLKTAAHHVAMYLSPAGQTAFVLRRSSDMSHVGCSVDAFDIPTGLSRGVWSDELAYCTGGAALNTGEFQIAFSVGEGGAVRVARTGPTPGTLVSLGILPAEVNQYALVSFSGDGRQVLVTTWRGRTDAYRIRQFSVDP